ncbi:MAG: TRAP transporter small permease [Desulfomonilaceae bacterium]
MNKFMSTILKVDFSLFVIAGFALVIMMLVTLVDVTMRSLGSPIMGSVELISFCGALAIGLSIPYTTWTKGHILVDFAVQAMGQRLRKFTLSLTRIAGIVLFVIVAVNFILFGLDMMKSNQISGALKLPLYPIAFGLAVSCFLQTATLICDLVKVLRGDAHE